MVFSKKKQTTPFRGTKTNPKLHFAFQVSSPTWTSRFGGIPAEGFLHSWMGFSYGLSAGFFGLQLIWESSNKIASFGVQRCNDVDSRPTARLELTYNFRWFFFFGIVNLDEMINVSLRCSGPKWSKTLHATWHNDVNESEFIRGKVRGRYWWNCRISSWIIVDVCMCSCFAFSFKTRNKQHLWVCYFRARFCSTLSVMKPAVPNICVWTKGTWRNASSSVPRPKKQTNIWSRITIFWFWFNNRIPMDPKIGCFLS